MVFEYGVAPYHTDALAPTPAGPMRCICMGPRSSLSGGPLFHTSTRIFRRFFADWEIGKYHTVQDDLVDNASPRNGAEYSRMAVFSDDRVSGRWGNTGVSTGLTAFAAEWCSVELGYQYNMFPELHPDFGYSNTLPGDCFRQVLGPGAAANSGLMTRPFLLRAAVSAREKRRAQPGRRHLSAALRVRVPVRPGHAARRSLEENTVPYTIRAIRGK